VVRRIILFAAGALLLAICFKEMLAILALFAAVALVFLLGVFTFYLKSKLNRRFQNEKT
jgi:Flp pilus assembly protein TadB